MRVHTGLAITSEIGVLMSESKNKYLNTKRSNECNLVGAGDSLLRVLLIHHFIDTQGYPLTNNLFFQENESTIKLEIYVPSLSRKPARQVNIKYFHIKDLVDKNIITVKHYPNSSMVADLFTNSLQGKLFR